MFSYLEFIQILCKSYRKCLDQCSHYIQIVYGFSDIYSVNMEFMWIITEYAYHVWTHHSLHPFGMGSRSSDALCHLSFHWLWCCVFLPHLSVPPFFFPLPPLLLLLFAQCLLYLMSSYFHLFLCLICPCVISC